jgi:hypothetical protein
LNLGRFAYAHELNNAIRINDIRTLIYNASNNPKNSTNQTIFADGMARIEAGSVYSSVLVALETSTENSLPLPDSVINAVIDALSNTITQQAALDIIFNFIKNGGAVDEAGNPIYQGYIDYYNAL